jgi:hypothetical protein
MMRWPSPAARIADRAGSPPQPPATWPFYFTRQGHMVTIAGAGNAAVLGVFVAVALAVSLLARDAARRTRQTNRAAAECTGSCAWRWEGPRGPPRPTGCGRRCSRRSATTCVRRWGVPSLTLKTAVITMSATGGRCLA